MSCLLLLLPPYLLDLHPENPLLEVVSGFEAGGDDVSLVFLQRILCRLPLVLIQKVAGAKGKNG